MAESKSNEVAESNYIRASRKARGLTTDQASIEEDRRILVNARKRFDDTVTDWSEVRKQALQDQRFYLGEDDQQWTRQGTKNNKPRIKVNQIPLLIKQLEQHIRQQNISMVVHPTDVAGSPEKAKLLTGMLRHIQDISNAKEAFINAAGATGALVPGFGFMRVDTHYLDETTFDQEIYIAPCKDPFKILPDFNATRSDFSDAEFWFEISELSKEQFAIKYSASPLTEFNNWQTMQNIIGTKWMAPTKVQIVKYWYREPHVRHLGVFEDGTVGYLDDFGWELNSKGEYEICDETKAEEGPKVALSPQEQAQLIKAADDKALPSSPDEFPATEALIEPERLAQVIRHREVVTYSVHWCITNGVEILDRGEWHDSEFPFVAVCGNDVVLDGKRMIFGSVRHAKDSQKMANFMASELVARTDAASKTPWQLALQSVKEPQRYRWEHMHDDPATVVYYDAYDNEGRPLPPPKRSDADEPAIERMLQAMAVMQQGVKQTVGVFEAGIGETVGERQSGTAIQTLAQRGEMNNMHVSQNLVMAIKRLGYLILRLVPKIYDTPRAVRIINPDDSAEVVMINQIWEHNGNTVEYDVAKDSNYDVVVDTGPSFATRRAEISEQMLKFAATAPALAPAIMDLIAHQMDWDPANMLEDRIVAWQSMTMPQLHQLDQDALQNLPPEAKALIGKLQGQLTQANQHVQVLAGTVNQQKQTLQSDALGHASKERIEALKSFTQLRSKQLDLIAEQSQAQDQMHLARVKAQLDHTNSRMGHIIDMLRLHQEATGQNNDQLIKMLQAMATIKPPPTDAAPPGTNAQTPTDQPLS